LPAVSLPIGYHPIAAADRATTKAHADDEDDDNNDDTGNNRTTTRSTNGRVLPIGFQFMGDAWTENKLLRLGYIIEQYYLKNRLRKPMQDHYLDVLGPWLS